MTSPFDVFLEPEARRINDARLRHVASLGLDLERKRVLEVGAGIGLLTSFFEQRGCEVLSTDGAPRNVAKMLDSWPDRRLGLLDLDEPAGLRRLGHFDIVFCYGTLYHLRDPDGALARLAEVCNGFILLETIVSRGGFQELHKVLDPPSANQAVSGIGCRPTRAWVMAALRRHFGHAYTTCDQPEYPDFVTDWNSIDHLGNLRAVFVGARHALSLPTLTEALPVRHRNAVPPPHRATMPRVWIDVGAQLREDSRSAARGDADLVVHAFDPFPRLCGAPSEAPPNYSVHAMAVGEQNGIAPFRVNRFDAASALLPIDETIHVTWTDGQLPTGERMILVPVTRLDSFMRRYAIDRVDLLKIDAQRADLAVLRSAGIRLSDIDRVQLSVAATPRPLYQGAAMKREVLEFMAARGFRVVESAAQSPAPEARLTFVRQS